MATRGVDTRDLADLSRAAPAARSRSSFGARLRFRLSGVLRRSERILDGMVSGYENLCRLDEQDSADIYLSMGEEFSRGGDASDAISALERSIALRPNRPEPHYQLGLVYLRQGASSSAIKCFRRARMCGLDSFELCFNLADALAEADCREQAVTELELALRKRPGDAEAAFRLGVLLDQLKRYDQAVVAFKRAITLSPREVSYYQSLGFTLESLDRRGEALECFKRAIDLERRATR